MNRSNMCGKLVSLGLPRHVSQQIVNQIKTWEDNCGTEWTVKRLKDLKQIYIKSLSGESHHSDSYIRKNKEGLPSGPISAVFRRFGVRKLNKTLTALMSYTSFTSAKATRAQKKKFFSALESEETKGLQSRLKTIDPLITSRRMPRKPPSLVEYCVSSTRMPGINKMVPERGNYVAAAVNAAMSEPIRQVISQYPEEFKGVIPLRHFFNIDTRYPEVRPTDHTFGSISGIQEPGLKLRVVANPNRVIQCALEPLKHELGRVLRGIAEDCTFDQYSALDPIQAWLREGKTVYSVDLSDATTLFPWFMTKDLLNRRFPNFRNLVSIMDCASTGPWRSNIRKRNEVVHFFRGQPLGLGPSFFAFALTHHALIRGICKKEKVGTDCYRILGDDIVIANHRVAKVYLRSLFNIGCKISYDKTIISARVAEFAGFVVTPTTIGKGLKWKDLSDHSFLESVKRFGRNTLAQLTPGQRSIVSIVSRIPTSLGGLGWSSGKKLSVFLNTDTGRATLNTYLHVIEKRLEQCMPCENLEYHLRMLAYGMTRHRSGPDMWERTIHGKFFSYRNAKAGSWRQLLNTDYLITPRAIAQRTNIVQPRTIRSEKVPNGYFRAFKKPGDPRPSMTTLAFVVYKDHLDHGGVQDREAEKFFSRAFRTSFSNLDLNVMEIFSEAVDIGQEKIPEPPASHIV